MDAIESGIVKIPRIPVDDDAAGKELVYLQLWDNIQPPLPKRRHAATRRRHGAAGLGDAGGARRGAAQPLPQLRAELRALRGRVSPRSASRRRC